MKKILKYIFKFVAKGLVGLAVIGVFGDMLYDCKCVECSLTPRNQYY